MISQWEEGGSKQASL